MLLLGSTRSTYTNACMAALSKNVLHGQSNPWSSLHAKQWAHPTWDLIPNSTRLFGPGVSKLFLTDWGWSSRVSFFLFRSLSFNSYNQLSGKRNDEEDAKEKLYTYVSHVPVTSFKVPIQLLSIVSSSDFCTLGSSNGKRWRRLIGLSLSFLLRFPLSSCFYICVQSLAKFQNETRNIRNDF